MSWIITSGLKTPWAEGGDSVYTIVVAGTTYRVHEFKTVGTSNLVVLNGGIFEYLIIGGGGGGGVGFGAGGGAGGYREGSITASTQPYSIIVGDGGLAGPSSNTRGSNGQLSSFAGIEAAGGGGGGGGAGAITAGLDGGSGGGGGGGGAAGGSGNVPATTPAQGNNGAAGLNGVRGGGGGGAGAAGSGRDGGTGKYSSITGTSIGYAGGGAANSTTGLGNASEGGGGLYSGVVIPAAANRGGGGRGDSSVTGKGGSGIIIVRYAIA